VKPFALSSITVPSHDDATATRLLSTADVLVRAAAKHGDSAEVPSLDQSTSERVRWRESKGETISVHRFIGSSHELRCSMQRIESPKRFSFHGNSHGTRRASSRRDCHSSALSRRFPLSRRNYSRHPPPLSADYSFRWFGKKRDSSAVRRPRRNRREGRAARARSLRSPLTSGRKIYYID